MFNTGRICIPKSFIYKLIINMFLAGKPLIGLKIKCVFIVVFIFIFSLEGGFEKINVPI